MDLKIKQALTLTLFCAVLNSVCVLSDEGKVVTRRSVGYGDFFPNVTDLEEQCLLVKGQEFVDKFNAEKDKAFECLEPTIDTMLSEDRDWVNELTDLSDKEILQLRIEETCHAASEVKRCIWDVLQQVMLCMLGRVKENVNGIVNAAFKAMEYVCYSKGVRYIDILQDKVQECGFSREEGLSICWKDFDNLENDPVDMVIPFSRQTCRVISDGASCTIKELSQCVDRKSAEIIRGLFDIVLKELPCKKFSHNSKMYLGHWFSKLTNQYFMN